MLCWARYLFILTVVALGITGIVGACGRKGPLYLPKEEPPPTTQPQSRPQGPAVPAPPAPAPATAAEPDRP